MDQINRLEHQADQITHDVVTRLDRVFITPLDREDIRLLASRLDDVMDLIDGTTSRLHIFRAGDAPVGATLIAELITRATTQLQVAVEGLEQNKGLFVAERRDCRRGSGESCVCGPVGSGNADRLGVGADDPDERDYRRSSVFDAEIGRLKRPAPPPWPLSPRGSPQSIGHTPHSSPVRPPHAERREQAGAGAPGPP